MDNQNSGFIVEHMQQHPELYQGVHAATRSEDKPYGGFGDAFRYIWAARPDDLHWRWIKENPTKEKLMADLNMDSNRFDIRLPLPYSNVLESTPHGYVAIYREHFRFGLRLPIHSFVTRMLDHYQLSLCQLSPNSISNVIAYIMFCKIHKKELSMNAFTQVYRLQYSKEGCCWWSIQGYCDCNVCEGKPYLVKSCRGSWVYVKDNYKKWGFPVVGSGPSDSAREKEEKWKLEFPLCRETWKLLIAKWKIHFTDLKNETLLSATGLSHSIPLFTACSNLMESIKHGNKVTHFALPKNVLSVSESVFKKEEEIQGAEFRQQQGIGFSSAVTLRSLPLPTENGTVTTRVVEGTRNSSHPAKNSASNPITISESSKTDWSRLDKNPSPNIDYRRVAIVLPGSPSSSSRPETRLKEEQPEKAAAERPFEISGISDPPITTSKRKRTSEHGASGSHVEVRGTITPSEPECRHSVRSGMNSSDEISLVDLLSKSWLPSSEQERLRSLSAIDLLTESACESYSRARILKDKLSNFTLISHEGLNSLHNSLVKERSENQQLRAKINQLKDKISVAESSEISTLNSLKNANEEFDKLKKNYKKLAEEVEKGKQARALLELDLKERVARDSFYRQTIGKLVSEKLKTQLPSIIESLDWSRVDEEASEELNRLKRKQARKV